MAIANRHSSVGKLVGNELSAEQPCFDSCLFKLLEPGFYI